MVPALELESGDGEQTLRQEALLQGVRSAISLLVEARIVDHRGAPGEVFGKHEISGRTDGQTDANEIAPTMLPRACSGTS